MDFSSKWLWGDKTMWPNLREREMVWSWVLHAKSPLTRHTCFPICDHVLWPFWIKLVPWLLDQTNIWRTTHQSPSWKRQNRRLLIFSGCLPQKYSIGRDSGRTGSSCISFLCMRMVLPKETSITNIRYEASLLIIVHHEVSVKARSMKRDRERGKWSL